jgi:ankyrin repeat protein
MSHRRLLAFIAFAITLSVSIFAINALSWDMQYALTVAAGNGNVTRMRLLIASGADVNPPTGGMVRPLYSASSAGQLNAVELLLDKGADINGSEKFGNTALTIAAHSGQLDVVRLLISRGAKVNAIGEDGTALNEAENQRHTEIVELLRQAGGKEGKFLR